MREIAWTNLPELLTLRLGERQAVRLPSLAAAGYRWVVEVDGDAVAVCCADAVGVAEAIPGVSLDEIFVVTARSAGRATVRFRQRRPWEGGSANVTQVLDIAVRGK